MARQTINIGSTANDGTGDPLRTAFNKVNENFIEVYDGINVFDQNLNTSNNVTFNEVSVNDDLTISGSIVSNSSFTVTSEIGATSSGVFLDGVNDAILFATSNVIIRSDNDGTFKDLTFSANGNLEAPGTISANSVNATNHFRLPVYATDAARDSAIPSPQPGMMVFVTAGEGAGLQVRGATQWNPVGGLTGV